MSTEGSNSLELSPIPRSASANRFQVDKVGTGKNSNGAAPETPEDEDQFNENGTEAATKRRTSRIQSIKSSFRDMTGKKDRKESITRFKVADNSDSNDEDENLLDGSEYDEKYGRSFR